jgi:hypothetical protein
MKRFAKHKVINIALLLSVAFLLVSLLAAVFYAAYIVMGVGMFSMLWRVGGFDTPEHAVLSAFFQLLDAGFYGLFALTSLLIATIPFSKPSNIVQKASILCNLILSPLFFLSTGLKCLQATFSVENLLHLLLDLFPCICFVLMLFLFLTLKKERSCHTDCLWMLPGVLMTLAAFSKLFFIPPPDSKKISGVIFSIIGSMCIDRFFIYLSLSAILLLWALLLKKEKTARLSSMVSTPDQ